MGLTKYQQKRNFQRTAEPRGKVARRAGHAYVIQKHAASHLHYDFRLELDGVLKSWAVPKGPSLDPARKRLAMQVEDHPLEYGSFEGTIPQGEYGGGTVMLWDRGEWEPVGDAHEGLRNGKLKFHLFGEKLQGGWMLVRRGGTTPSDEDKPQWLLFKEQDDVARPEAEGDVLVEQPLSVSTGRDLDEIASDRDREWSSAGETNGTPASRGATARSASGKSKSTRQTASKGAVAPATKTTRASGKKKTSHGTKKGAASLPARIDVQLATLTKSAPEGDDWIHEIKFDGYRMLCRIDGGQAEFISRNQQNWTSRLRFLADGAGRLPVDQAILDGEVVALRSDGVSDFQELQNAFRDGRAGRLHYYVFDLLFLNGENLMGLPLEERRRRLSELLSSKSTPRNMHFSEDIAGHGADVLESACQTGLEGIICKRRDRPYQPGRGYDWLKVKCVQKEEFVIGAYTEPSGSRSAFGALLVGYHNSQGKLVYAGKVGTGFDERTLESLSKRLQPLEQAESPFSDLTRRTGGARSAHWVEPRLVGQFAFGSWTRDGHLRHASYLGLREDKPASEVVRDRALPLAAVSVSTTKAASKAAVKTAARSAARKPAKSHPARSTRVRATSDKPKAKESGSRAPAAGRRGDTGQEHARQESAAQELAGVRFTSPDKVLYPDVGVTKRDLAEFYQAVADRILPHLADRPVVLVRCPEGNTGECFFQKHPGVGTPDTLRRIPIREKSQTNDYVLVDDVAGLISLVQMGALEIHAWGSRADKLEQPDRLVFDLDPDPELPWKRVVESARQVREFLQALGLESFVKTTGGKGLHLVVPIERKLEWTAAKAFCRQVAELIVQADPENYTAKMSKALRPGKIFLDYLRNDRGATAVVPYSTRARPGAPVSTPLTWKELSSRTPSNHYTVENLPKRLASLSRDPWDEFAATKQSLPRAVAALEKLSES